MLNAPLAGQNKSASEKFLMYFAIITVTTVAVFALGLQKPRFSPDSWYYLELSNRVFTDFFRYNTQRQFEWASPYCNSCAPLWPCLIAGVRRLADISIYTGCLINLFVSIALAWQLMKLARCLLLPAWLGAAIYLVILFAPAYLEESLASRTIPLAILCFTITLRLLMSSNPGPRTALASGLAMGLGCLERFDAMPIAAVACAILVFRNWHAHRRIGTAVTMVACHAGMMLLVLSPWMLVNLHHFGKPFASDNSRQLLLARGGLPSNYYQHAPPAELITAPKVWIKGLLGVKLPRVLNGIGRLFRSSVLPILFLATAVVWGATMRFQFNRETIRLMWIGLIFAPFQILPSVAVGYGDERYYLAPFLMVTVLMWASLYVLVTPAWTRGRINLILAAVIILGLAINAPELLTNHHPLAPTAPTPPMLELTEAVKADAAGQPHRMIDTDNMRADIYGALTGEPVAFMPHLIDGSFASFLREWHITHIYDPGDAVQKVDLTGVTLVPLAYPKLFRVQLQ